MRRFIYRLAARLGYANPDAMLEEMSPHHIEDWANYLAEEAETLAWRLT